MRESRERIEFDVTPSLASVKDERDQKDERGEKEERWDTLLLPIVAKA